MHAAAGEARKQGKVARNQEESGRIPLCTSKRGERREGRAPSSNALMPCAHAMRCSNMRTFHALLQYALQQHAYLSGADRPAMTLNAHASDHVTPWAARQKKRPARRHRHKTQGWR